MSFVVTVPEPATEETPISAGAFWPAVDPAKVRDEHRIDTTITPPRLRSVLIEAIASVNAELAAWRIANIAAGVTALGDVTAESIDDQSILVHRYLRAVGCTAKALLMERYRDFDSTAQGDKKAEALTDAIDDIRRDARWAIADILGNSRTVVELI